MRNLFVLAFVLFFVSGCYLSHERPMVDSAVPVADAGTDASEIELHIRLSEDTPPPTTLARNSSGVRMARYDLFVNRGNVIVTDLYVQRLGIGATSDIPNVYIYDADTGARLTVARSIDSMTNVVSFSLDLFVTEDRPRSIVIVGDIDARIAGGQHAFGVTSVGYMVTSVESGDLIFVDGPLRAHTFTIGIVLADTLNTLQGTDLPEVSAGPGREVSNFRLESTAGNFEVRSVLLPQAGSIEAHDLTDLVLFGSSGEIAATPMLIERQFVFRLAVPYVLRAGSIANFSIRARVSGPSGRTIRTYAEYPADIEAIDLELGVPAHVDLTSFDGSVPENTSEVTIR